MMSGGDIRENIRVVRRKCPPQTLADVGSYLV